MRKTSRTLLAALAGATLVVAGCGDDPTGLNTGDELTQVEIDEIFTEIFDELAQLFVLDIGGGTSALSVGPISVSAASVPISETINASSSCGGGGTVTVTGSITGDIDDATFTGNISLEVTETLTNCVVFTSGGTNFTVNTNPNIRMTGDFSISETSFAADFDISGGFTFTGSDGRSGSCSVDVSVTISVSETTQEVVGTGTVCGRDVNAV